MNIYTRSGDEGETGLFGGDRVSKWDLRVKAYGEIDEVNAVLGWCAVVAESPLKEQLEREQQRLLDFGAWLATPPDASEKARAQLPDWEDSAATLLEEEIDAMESQKEPLRAFILPGGTELSARMHVARTVCRRAERAVCALAATESAPPAVHPAQLAWLNRLSDWLFVVARPPF
ncbi:MAG: cob(I)yrinic acid a,c-diamide adenosyltransferase [Planctomycetota bacterium]|jgi:cob(I)alamin adenosyltransferase|nr:cob(I)yrinic acid a,c-diamide adenosyltransferase [Planctomycetota bacterium]MDP6942277.1 cob(I)yrinic acid a,c-diamide adenosyltransferase [Planctomycetota bacterium]